MTDSLNKKLNSDVETIPEEVVSEEANIKTENVDKSQTAPEKEVVEETSSDVSSDADSDEEVEEEEVYVDPALGQWYIVQCYSNQEYRVRSRVQTIIDEKKYDGQLYRVLVPQEETVEIKNNKRYERVTKIFPGYVFVQMDYNEQVSFEIRSLPGVAKFIGSKVKATPVTEAEILKVLHKVGDKTKKVDVDFEEGEVIKVILGPFRGYTGAISEIHGDRGKLKSMISIFGRETPVELDFDQVEKVVK
ncbi:transcription termination/antitermination factor NusG [Candidatus Marinamargulisbacteria bacterium SCGC AAA071-K20]|nr:transcription termination/antitermination factor NusG [Candidatus Marinamargulisbacteria bacterium SCGC AAA071-K20]